MSETVLESVKANEGSKAIIKPKKGFLVTIFAPLLDKNLWMGMLSLMVKEFVFGAIMAGAHAILKWGSGIRGKDAPTFTTTPDNNVGNRAFGGGFSPAPSMDNSYRPASFQTTPSPDNRFPGFPR